MSENIQVSIIIPLLNEEKYIRNCLESLAKQTFPIEKTEWILVDGISSDKTVEIIKEYEQRYPIVLLMNEKKKTPYALNKGIDAAKGEYIIRMDAHAEFSINYVEKCVYYLENTDADNVGGIAETKSQGVMGKAIAYMLSTKFGVGGSAFRTSTKSGYVDTVPFGAFRATTFKKYGMFNTELLRSEDNEMNARIRNNGGKIYLSNEIIFTYYCRDSIVGLLKMALQNGNALFRTMRVDPKAMSMRHYIPFLFFVSVVSLPIFSMIYFPLRYLLGLELTCYFLLDIYYSALKNKYGFITIWLYPLFHLAYGLGSFLGMLNINLY